MIGAALLVVLAGCASSTPIGAQGSGPTLTTSPAPTSPAAEPEFESPVPPGGKEVPKDRLDATGVPEGNPATAWTEGDGTVLGVVGQEAGCGKASVEIAEQGPQVVKVVLVETQPIEQQVCTMDIRYPPLTAKLDAPLGERKVVLIARQDQK